MKLLKKLIVILFAATMLSACGGGNSPEAVAESYVKAYFNVDFKKAASLATKEYGAEILGEVEGLSDDIIKTIVKARKEELKGITYKVTEVGADEEEAVVMFEFTKDGETDDGKVELIKEDGKWKVEYERIRF